MADDRRQLTLDELELSVRSSELLQSLGVQTLGQLLDLPKIEIPDDVPLKTARLMVAELEELFEDMGVEYAGTIEAPQPEEATQTATGTIAERWQTIAAWLHDHHPGALAGFHPPASSASIAAAEEALGKTLPDDYKQFLALHNGQHEHAPWVGLGALLPIEKVVKARTGIYGEEVPVPAEMVGRGVRAVDYSPGWIPITRSARGRDYLCLDLDPAPGGIAGQIIEYVVDGGERPLVARSFADLLSLYFEQAQRGEIEFDREH